MERNFLQNFAVDYKRVLIGEIALNGLEGICLELLWKYMEKKYGAPLTSKLKCRYWCYLRCCKDISFYELPEPVVVVDLYDRFSFIDETRGIFKDPEIDLEGPYEYCPVKDEYGSCKNYEERILIPNEVISKLSYESVQEQYSNKLVIVATLEERWHALAPHLSMMHLSLLNPMQYCFLELVGRSRENGQGTVGQSHLFKIVKEPKFLFYVRLALTKMDLIKATSIPQITAGKGIRTQLIRLKRFYKPALIYMIKIKKQRNIIGHLLSQPDFTGSVKEMVKKGLLEYHDIKILRKRANHFLFKDVELPVTAPTKKKKCVLDKVMSLTPISDSSSDTDEEQEEPLRCVYNVGVPLLRSAYELILSMGYKGVTQNQMSQLLGVEFHTSRTLCRVLKSKHLIREYLEDKGRQRTTRFIAVDAPNNNELQYVEEQNKYKSFLENTKVAVENTEEGPPAKKIKIEKNTDNPNEEKNLEYQIEEVKLLTGVLEKDTKSLSNSKALSLRQLKFANGLIKIVHEKRCVSGYQPLSKLVGEAVNEPPLDTKPLKRIVLKLANDKQLKVLKLKWPNKKDVDRYSVLICAPDITYHDPIIKAKYKEICIRSVNFKNIAKEVPIPNDANSFVTQYAYPRYMKIQKLHEFLTQLVYFNDKKADPLASEGVVTLVTILSEITLELALGNLKKLSLAEIYSLKVDESTLKLKIPECGPNVHSVLYRMKNIDSIIRSNLKVLGILGLIQMIAEPTKTKDQNSNLACCVVYVNRHAKIINTTGIWPKDGGKIELSYKFNSMEDVKHFWEKVYNISTNTTVTGLRDSKKVNTFDVPRRFLSEVKAYDPSVPMGDGNGPCGYDSGVFMDLKRNWRNLVVRKRNVSQTNAKPVKKVVAKKKKNVKPKKPKVAKVIKARLPKCGVVEDRGYCPSKRTRRPADTSILWSAEEDRVVIMCRAAMTIMAPVTMPGSLTVTNSVMKDILTMKDPKKIAYHCHARAVALDTHYDKSYEKNSIINEMRRRKKLIQKYENSLKIIRLRNTGSHCSYIREARIRMMELVWIINQVYKSEAFNKKTPCVAIDYQDFKDNFKITPPVTGIQYKKYTAPQTEVELATLKEGVMSAVACSVDRKIATATRIYTVLKKYPEPMLRMAVDELRKSGAVVTYKETNSVIRTHFREMVQSAFRTSSAYQRRVSIKFTESLIDVLPEELNNEISHDNIKGSPSINCGVLESYTNGSIETVLITDAAVSCPASTLLQEEQLNNIDVEAKYKLKAGVVGWRSEKEANSFFDFIKEKIMLDDALNSIKRHSLITFNKLQNVSVVNNEIIAFVKSKGQIGATFDELCKATSQSVAGLLENLRDLLKEGAIYKVGYTETVIIHAQFIKFWTLNVDKCYVIPAQWVTVDLTIKYDVILKWMSTIVYKLFTYPGFSIVSLAESCEYLNPSNVYTMCNILRDFECVYYKVFEPAEPDLFSDVDDDIPINKEYHEFESLSKILVFPACDMLMKFSYLKKLVWDSAVTNNS